MRRRQLLRRISVPTFLLLCSGVSCASWTKKPAAELPKDAVCRAPSAAESRALQTLVRDVMPSDGQGNSVDLSPGDPLPDGVLAPARPDLYEAASWATGMFCRCYPEHCSGAQAHVD